MNNKISRRRFIATGLVASVVPGITFAGSKSSGVSEKEKGLVFLFQGDSITDGNWGRDLDGNHFLGHGYVFAIAARLGADFPQAGFTFHNRGISGHKVSDLEKRWDKDTLALKPDVLSILVGINDVNAVFRENPDACDVDVFEEKYRSLLRITKEANPNILLVLGAPFIYPVGVYKEHWDFWSKETSIWANAVEKLANEFDAVFVDYPAMFEKATKLAPIEHWTWDGCHPSVPGHELMAREWIKQVSARLKFLKKYK
ncbi:MAG: SGNH/GDSL hydrolase family protein [Dysgonamonadaceae bacterium]|jgi:lysophospholipase L1-like esterase|nr:SGNH/GDSL hydrolase family protein [Dysgonamonadaceae bacterium]